MFPLTTIYTTFVFRKKSWIAFTVRSVCSFETVIVRGHFQGRTENGRRCRKDDRVSLGTKTPTQITSPGAAWILLHFGQQGLNVYLKIRSSVIQEDWACRGEKEGSSSRVTFQPGYGSCHFQFQFRYHPLSPLSFSTLNMIASRQKILQNPPCSVVIYEPWLWNFDRLPDMHGHYELLRSTSSENRDLKAGEVNLKRLGANLRFSSDSVAGPSLWARTSFGGDFILIAEFSENEGPKPVVSLPEIQLIRFKPPSFENKKLFLVYYS